MYAIVDIIKLIHINLMKILNTIIILLFPGMLCGQGANSLTAAQILNSSIEFSGGENRIKNIKSTDANYLLIQLDKSTAIINQKIKTGEKYVQCILSMTHVPQTTFFNGKVLSTVNGSSVTHVDSLNEIEEIRLKTYSQLQFGYKTLGYKLTRLPDKNFQNFDCYVISAAASNGYTTVNFFDKKNYRLLMVVYPSGNKSLMVDYVFQDSVLFNTHVINTFTDSNTVQELRLQQVELNPGIADIWFNCPYERDLSIPDYIKTGQFESTTGPRTEFVRSANSQDYKDETGKLIGRRFLKWINDDTYRLIDHKAIQNKDLSPESEILVRIISWDKQGYVCQWIAGKYTDTQEYRLKD